MRQHLSSCACQAGMVGHHQRGAVTLRAQVPRWNPIWLIPRLMATALVGWWMTNVAFHTLGVLDGSPVGYGAWQNGFFGFPRWFQGIFAAVGVVSWTMGALVAGGAVTLHGVRAVRWILATAFVSAAVSILLVVVLTWLWPGSAEG